MADLKLSDSPNVDTVYVTTDDGKQHKAKLVANLPTDNLELSDSPNVLYGYATINGKKHRVLLTAVVHDGDVVRKSETMMQTLSGPLSVTDEICLIDREDQTAKYSVAMVAGIPTETAEEMDIIGNRKFDVSPTSDETTAYSNLNPQKLITKGQIAPVITDLNDKINLAATSGNLIGSYWFGKSETGFTPPNPTDASQNYFDFTTNTPYTAKADLSGWDAGTPIGNPTVDSQIQITSKFWNIPEQADQQGGTAYWAHSSNEWSYAPKIISFESPNLSGTPTAPDLTADSPDAQIVNKNALQTATTELSNAISALSTTVDTKANQSDLTALSSTVSTLQTTVGTKADSATVTSELATKATKATDFITPLSPTNKGVTQADLGTNLGTNTITNCITEIPQNIKLELNGDVLTLKAGSKAYTSDGLVIEIPFDQSRTITETALSDAYPPKYLLFAAKNYLALQGLQRADTIGSGPETPTNTPGGINTFFNTTNNKFYYWTGGTDAHWEEWEVTLPIAEISITTGSNGEKRISITNVFNAFGYMGSTIFVLPGVKGLVPNGRNEDGTLKSINITTEIVRFSTVAGSTNRLHIQLFADKNIGAVDADNYYEQPNTPPNKQWSVWYDTYKNRKYLGNGETWAEQKSLDAGWLQRSGTTIVDFETKLSFQAVDASNPSVDYVISTQRVPLDRTYAWYRKYKSGWVEQMASIPILSTDVPTDEIKFNLPIRMNTTYMTYQVSAYINKSNWNTGNAVACGVYVRRVEPNVIGAKLINQQQAAEKPDYISFYVCGMAA